MLVNRYYYGYSNKKKHVTGKGFVDSLSNIFNTIKSATAPVFKTVGNYVSENKDLDRKTYFRCPRQLSSNRTCYGDTNHHQSHRK